MSGAGRGPLHNQRVLRSRLRAVLFDWDGTLVNSADLTYRCYERLFGRFGVGFGRDEFERTYSPDWYATYRALGLPESEWEAADRLFVEVYAAERAELLPGVPATLDQLGARGLLLGIVTSGSRQRVSRELEALGVHTRFDAVVCREDSVQRKPHPEPLLVALQALGVGTGEAVYVGDSPEDVAMARSAGVLSVGIPGGFPNREALQAARPDMVAGSLQEAVTALRL